MHGILDPLFLNATAVSDFFLNFNGKSTPCNNPSTALGHKNKPYRYPPCCGVSKSQKQRYKYSLTFDDLHQNVLPGIPVPQ